MTILFEEKNVKFSDSMKEYVEKKIKENKRKEVIVSFSKLNNTKFAFSLKNGDLKIVEEGTDYYALCDLVCDKFNKLILKENKLKKSKKLKEIHKQKLENEQSCEDEFLGEEEE